jgi:hypothetical protein
MQRDHDLAPQSRRSFARTGKVQPKSLLVGTWLLSSAVIAAWVVCLPLSTGTSEAGFESYSVAARSTTSNSAVKGDRLDRVPPRTEIGASPARSRSQPESSGAPAPTSKQTLPIGCETAFGKFAASRNLSARCVTSIDHVTKLA